MRILLVEDEAPLRETLAARLKREGFAVDAAQDGEEGLYMGREVPFDVGIIDLGLPRNVAPDVVEVAGIELLDLETIRLHAPLEALNATSDARAIVRTAARAFTEVAEEQTLTPSVVALRRHVFDILDAEIERLHTRGEGSKQTEAALRHLAGVLLHVPMVRSREHARAGEHAAYIGGLEAVFGISAASRDSSVPVDSAAPAASRVAG